MEPLLRERLSLTTLPCPRGSEVYVLSRDPEHSVRLSADELAELEAGLAEADRGETISGEELFEQLRRHG
jgi:predicted transcriptional regulator